ncbi:hypothetical protein [Psychrobacillus sp. FSL K6-1464]|uniref:hypothetical protein n=1 Tax=Psychrobacillus sp. FSL K6-1464 TaxID=2921545 RepID=UPI0030F9F922
MIKIPYYLSNFLTIVGYLVLAYILFYSFYEVFDGSYFFGLIALGLSLFAISMSLKDSADNKKGLDIIRKELLDNSDLLKSIKQQNEQIEKILETHHQNSSNKIETPINNITLFPINLISNKDLK